MKTYDDLRDFAELYGYLFNFALEDGNYNGYFGPIDIFKYMAWRSFTWKGILMTGVFGDTKDEEAYKFQDFVTEKHIQLPAKEVNETIEWISVAVGDSGWRFHTGKKKGYKFLLPNHGGKMVDDFLNKIEKKLANVEATE